MRRLLYLLCILLANQVHAQAPDTTRLLKGAVRHSGLFTVYQNGEKYYLEVPDTLLATDLLLVTRIAQNASGVKAYAGDALVTTVVTFEKRGDKLLLRKDLSSDYTGDSTRLMYRNVIRSNLKPVIAALTLVQRRAHSSLADITDLLLGDNELFSFNGVQKSLYKLTALAADRSYVSGIHTFPLNLELATVKTYTVSRPLTASVSITSSATFELNTSIILLPRKPMQQRFQDARVGYFATAQTDYDANPSGIQVRAFINRWRLEPQPEDMQKYQRGELVEPRKPIVFYIDPTTPEKWIPYLIQGVNDWVPAIEKAGFKNAIRAERAPSAAEDSTWSLFDARHSAIVYKPSDNQNAEGVSISDPRSGEILESHINWYHNIMQLVHDWYMVQCGVNDTAARHFIFSDRLMGQLIRAVCSHEIGHTLGLTHNMGASSAVPTDSLRNKAWVAANGICPSIMDYARFNYVAQPEDRLSENELLPRINDYDRWAIEWGYRLFPQFRNPEDEQSYLNHWIIEKTRNKRLRFEGEHATFDPRAQTEDLGDDAVLSSTYGIKNLKRSFPQLSQWTTVPNDGAEHLDKIYKAALDQYQRYLGHVIASIGGIREDLHPVEQLGPAYAPVPAAYQRKAMAFLDQQFFRTPVWLVDTAILNQTGRTPIGELTKIQQNIFNQLLFIVKLLNIKSRTESAFGPNNFTLIEYLDDLKQMIFNEVSVDQPIDAYRQALQKSYIHELLLTSMRSKDHSAFSMPITGNVSQEDSGVTSLIYGQLLAIKRDMERVLSTTHDWGTRAHLQYLISLIKSKTDKTNDVQTEY